jgi:hypothetical protein
MTEQENLKKSVLQSFITSIIESKNEPKILLVNASDFKLFNELKGSNTNEISSIEEIPNSGKFDVIIGDLPFHGTVQQKWCDPTNNKIIKAQSNWLEILKSLYRLEDQGSAIFLVEPHGLSNNQGRKFEKELNDRGFYTNGIFNCPEKLLYPQFSFTPVLISISKKESSNIYLAELDEVNQAKRVAHNFLSLINTEKLTEGTLTERNNFVGFHRLKIQQQIERLESQYKEYDTHILKDIASEINSIKSGETFEEKENTIYIPKIGKSKVGIGLQDLKLKHHNYFQVILKENILNEYMASFFESTLGKLILDSLSMQSFIPHTNKQDIEQALIAIPSIAEQQSIVLTQNKLHNLKNAIEDFSKEIALNPTSSSSIQGQLNRMLEAITILTDADRVRAIVREGGESTVIEFKESLSLDIKRLTNDQKYHPKKESDIENSSLKTIVGFLNAKGGSLLVGVSDVGKITGIDREIERFHKNSTDDFLLHFKNLLKEKIGGQFYPFINHRLVNLDGVHILLVDCEASPIIPCYLENKDFYVRTNPSTDKLEGSKMLEYIQSRFRNKETAIL